MLKNLIHYCFISVILCIGFPLNALTGIAENEQRKFDYYFYEAINAKVTENYDSYWDFLNYCFQIDSTNAAVLYEFGNFYNTINDKSEALEYFKNAVENDNDNFYYNASLADLYLELQQYTEAINVYEYLLTKDPSKYELYLYLSESYRLDGDLPKAIETLDKLEVVAGLNEKISLQKFQLYSVLDDKNKAYAEFQKYIDKYPNDVKYYVFLGNLYMQDNKNDDAYEIFERAKTVDPENPYLITSFANYYEKTGKKADAERELQSALFSTKMDIDSKLEILAQYIGNLQHNEGDTERANALLDTLIVLNPVEPKLNLIYGNLLMIQQKTDEALFQFQIFTDANPTNPVGWEQMIKTVPNDSLDKSIEITKQALSYLPDEPIFYYYLAIGQYQKKEYDEAIKTLTNGISIITEDDNPFLVSELYGLMGGMYFEIAQPDSAFIAYQNALRYNPQNLGILNNYSYHLALEKKDLDKAEKMSSYTIKAEPTNPTYLDTYGWVLFEQGDYVTAKIYLENAVKYSEEKEKEVISEVLEHYGDVLSKLGDNEKALEYWNRAREKGDSDSKTLEQKIKEGKYISEL